jgi:hypothetical protein
MPRVSPVFKVTLPMSQNRNKNSRTRNPSVQTQSNTVNLCFESSREFDTESILLSWFLLTPGDRIYIYYIMDNYIYILIYYHTPLSNLLSSGGSRISGPRAPELCLMLSDRPADNGPTFVANWWVVQSISFGMWPHVLQTSIRICFVNISKFDVD